MNLGVRRFIVALASLLSFVFCKTSINQPERIASRDAAKERTERMKEAKEEMKATINLRTPRILIALCLVAASASGNEMVENPAERWSSDGPGGTPEFSRHILPLIGKAGCNNRNCHGSFQGQNGFQLSLFGSDPAADWQELAQEDNGDGPRVNVADPDASLALLMPTSDDEHGGGQRFEAGSWQYRMLRQWIAAGALYEPKTESRIVRLDITPAEIVMHAGDEPAPLRLIAEFSDGTREDVTALTTFASRDESVTEVFEDGSVSALRSGDTAIVATFGPEVTTSQVLVPRNDDGAPFPEFAPINNVDALVLAKLRKLNVRPSELATDEVFVRRVYLDMIGKLPAPDEVRQFLNDGSADKRRRLIDSLLSRPEYAQYWGLIFSDITGNQGINPHPQVSHLWQSWLEDKLARNWPYDKIVGGILTATSLEGRPREALLAEIDAVRNNMEIDPEMPYRWTSKYDNGVYARRETLDLYWLRIPNRKPDRVALQTAAAFLGVRLDCAQCHKHPFDRWTSQDFEQFQSFFRFIQYRYAPTGGELPRKGRICYGRDEIVVGMNKRWKNVVQRYPPKLLGGDEVSYEDGEDPRVALWKWMRQPDNPYFARTIVNRIWAHYFGTGLVEPIEDFSNGNPPSNPRLLDWLTRDFIDSGFDLKHLHRTIAGSRTYQFSWVPNDSNRTDRRSYSHALFRRLPAEVLVHAIETVTGVPYRFNYTPRGAVPITYASTLRMPYPLELFGRGRRKQACGNCERTSDPALNQALYLLTDSDITDRIGTDRGHLKRLSKSTDNRAVVEDLYLSTLSRFPTDVEMQETLGYLEECDSRDEWMEDLLWSLLNVREFVFQH